MTDSEDAKAELHEERVFGKPCPICGNRPCKVHVAHWGSDWQWFALRVTPGREFTVQGKLQEADHFTFVPVKHALTKQSRKAKRKVLSARAQYSGYVFLGQPPGFLLPWKYIDEIEGILGAIGRDGEPMPILERTMTAMLAGTRRPINYVQIKAHRRRKPKGQNTAEIISGPYQGRTVRVIEIADDDPELYELFKAAA